MAKYFTVHKGKKYKAELELSWYEATLATNGMVAEQFKNLGFSNVVVTGSGYYRFAEGVWDHPDETVPLTDKHIVTVTEVNDAKV